MSRRDHSLARPGDVFGGEGATLVVLSGLLVGVAVLEVVVNVLIDEHEEVVDSRLNALKNE